MNIEKIKGYLMGKEVEVRYKAGIITDVFLESEELCVKYKNSEDEEKSIKFKNYLVTEFLEAPLGNVETYSDSHIILCQTGYTRSGVVVAVYFRDKDEIEEVLYANLEKH